MKMRNKFIPASENCCDFCGKWQENQKHIVECEGEKAVEIRTKLETIGDEKTKKDVKIEWLCENSLRLCPQ